MNKLFSSLSAMETVMIIMGMIIFLALVFLLIYQVMKQRAYVPLLIAFLIPIVFVGYPTIQSIKFQEGIIEITKSAQAVAANPKDTAASHLLEQKLIGFQNDTRVPNNPEALATVATAQLALGKLEQADSTIQKAKTLAPKSEVVNEAATAVMKQITLTNEFKKSVNALNQQVSKLQQQPKDTATTTRIINTLSTLKIPKYVDANAALVIARSYAVLNQREHSQRVIDNVLKSDTGSLAAKQLDKELNKEEPGTNAVKLTPAQKITIQQKLRYAPVVGDKAAIKMN